MKTFEERYAAWMDGLLSGSELEAFEKELDQRPIPELEDDREACLLRDVLRTYGAAPAMTNPDFFNHQIMARIAAEQPDRTKNGRFRSFWRWPFARFAWAGAIAAVLGWVVAKTLIPVIPGTPHQPEYHAQVIEAHSPDPNISATVVHSEQDNVTVLWLDGMEYLPASYELH